jgi:hypothetical protein
MQNWHQKYKVTWLALLSKLSMKFNFISNDMFTENVYHQKFCKKSKNIKISF